MFLEGIGRTTISPHSVSYVKEKGWEVNTLLGGGGWGKRVEQRA